MAKQIIQKGKGNAFPSFALRCSLPLLAGPQTPAPQRLGFFPSYVQNFDTLSLVSSAIVYLLMSVN